MKKLLVLGYYDRANLGDEMFKETIPKMFPNYRVDFVNSDDAATNNITQQIDNNMYEAIICGGGDIINDYFQRKILIATKNFTGPIYALGTGVPFPSLISRGYFDNFDHVFLREKTDVREVQKRLGSKYAHYLPDMGFLLEKPPKTLVNDNSICKGKRIGICLIQSIFNFKEAVRSLIQFLSHLLKSGYQLNFLCFNTNGKASEDDRIINKYVCDQLLSANSSNDADQIINDPTVYTTTEMLSILSSMDYNVCMRFHSNIFSTVVGTPFMSIFPTRKVELFVKDIDHAEYGYCMPKDRHDKPVKMDVAKLISMFDRLVSNRVNVANHLYNVQKEYHNLLQTDQVEILVSRRERRPKGIINWVDGLDLDKLYGDVRTFMIKETGFNPEQKDRLLVITESNNECTNPKISIDKAIKIAEYMSMLITGAPHNQYIYGSVNNIMEKPWDLKGMIDYIIKDFQNDFNTSRERLNMKYINQENFKGFHRSGWQYCVEYMKALHSDTGIIFDTYLDRTFHWSFSLMSSQGIIPYTSPWAGIVHHCPNQEYTDYNMTKMLMNPLFIKSLPMCKCIITLSTYLADWLRVEIPRICNTVVPVICMYHPTQIVPESSCWSLSKFLENRNRSLINVGGWYRNPASINLVTVNPLKEKHKDNRFKKFLCWLSSNKSNGYDDKIGKYGYYYIQKAALKGKNMDEYFCPDNLVICGTWNKALGKGYIKLTSDNLPTCIPTTGSTRIGSTGHIGVYGHGPTCGSSPNNFANMSCSPPHHIGQGHGPTCGSSPNNFVNMSCSPTYTCGCSPSNFTNMSCHGHQNPGSSPTCSSGPNNWSSMSCEPYNKKNKWLYYLEKYINENHMLIHEFTMSMESISLTADALPLIIDSIPDHFVFNLTDAVPKHQLYLVALQKWFIKLINSVKVISFMANDDYDTLLSRNIVFLNLVDCSACNTIIECIVRSTPILVNRHPAILEYIGEDYPLYYDSIKDIPDILTLENVKAAHEYLRRKDKSFLFMTDFIDSMRESDMYKNIE